MESSADAFAVEVAAAAFAGCVSWELACASPVEVHHSDAVVVAAVDPPSR